LRRVHRTYRTHPPTPPTPVETTTHNSEINISVNTSPNKEQDAFREQEEDLSSALSGYSPGRSSEGSEYHPPSSENTDYSSIHTTDWFDSKSPPRQTSGDNDDSPNPPNDNNEDQDLPKSKPSHVAPTKAKMAAVSFDPALEHFVLRFLKVKLTHEIAYALDQAFVNTFDEFCTINTVDIHAFTHKLPGETSSTLIHPMLVKQIERGVHYCQFLKDANDPACGDPTLMDYDTFNKWKQKGHAAYQVTLIPPGTVIAPTPIGGTTAAYVSVAQKDDDAALVSWNRKPRNVTKSYSQNRCRISRLEIKEEKAADCRYFTKSNGSYFYSCYILPIRIRQGTR
jgi:hypothetical protein